MELRGVLESSDVNEIKSKTDALQQAWTEAAQALYANASAQEQQSSGDGDSSSSDDEVVEDSAPASTEKADKIKAELDDLLDEIDEVLDENAEEFVRSYVQKGGQ